MWCHLLLAMPPFGLALFLVLPWPVALPLYLGLAALSLIIYAKIWQGMRQPVRTGQEAMQGRLVTVTRQVTPSGGQVRYRNELWSARSSVRLDAGRQASIVDVHGMKLVVQPLEDG